MFALLAAGGLAAPRALAADDAPWRARSDLVFTQVAQNADLPHALVPFTLQEAANGFLWLGGDAGLLRWDGYEFRDYPARPHERDGMRDAEIWTLHRDAHGQLWAGTKSNGLARYDAARDRLVCVRLAEGPGACGNQHVRAIDDDGTGGIWVATNSGLFRLDAAGKVVGCWRHDPGQPASLPDDQVLSVLRDRRGVLWVGTLHGLASSEDGGATFRATGLPADRTVAVSHLMQDSAGRLWIGTQQSGVFVIRNDSAGGVIVPGTAAISPDDTAIEVTSILEIAQDRIWIATDGGGIVAVDATNLHTQRIRHDPFVPNSLDSDSVQSLYRDASGLAWIGTENGLSQYNPVPGILTFFGHPDRRDGLPGDGVMSILPTADNKTWFGLQGAGFVVLDGDGRRVSGLPGHRVFALAPRPGGGVLLGTDGGLFAADPNGQTVRRLVVPTLNPTADIRVLRTLAGSVWLGGRDGGLFQLALGANDTVRVLRHETAPRLTDYSVTAVAAMPDGRLAVGTDSGVNFLDPNSPDKIEQVMPDPANPRGLDAGLVSSIAVDRRGRLWIGTSNGLDVMQGRDPNGRPWFHRLAQADGLPNASIDGLLVDRRGAVWASTDKGLAVIDPDNFTVRAVQRADGLAITNYWADAAAVAPDGALMFGGIGGMTLVRPDQALQHAYRPPVVFTRAKVGGSEVTLRDAAASLVVPPDANSLAVEFAALDFSAPQRNRYRYRLDGFDPDWIDTDAAHRAAAYTNLPPGQYTLRLRGSNRDGQWSTPETTLQVLVRTAWYQTVGFKLAITFLIGLVLFGMLRGWTSILRRRQHELERQVSQRTGELSLSQLQLQHANAVLELRVAERTQTLMERTAALEASEARFRAWFNNAEDAVFVVHVEPDGRFVYEAVNDAVARILGVPAAAFAGRDPPAVLPAEEAAIFVTHFHEAAEGAPVQFEASFASPDGERLIDTWIVPVRHPVTGRVERLVGASRDITERRALEARLAQAQKLQALGGLAGGIAHDFNNILQAVAGAAMLMAQRPDDTGKIQRLARSTLAATERGTSITKRLLAFARSDELRVEPVRTAEVLVGISEVLSTTLGATITLRMSLPAQLPPLLADRGQLETALVNLATNARDAMPDGGTLTLSATPETVPEGDAHPAGLEAGAYVRIEVTDTGFGMDATTLARVIEPFFTTKPPGQGTGLGLALVKGFTEQSGGGMEIESVPGQGTTVRLWLRQAAAGAGRRSAAPAAPAPATRAPNARILVVDDDDLVRETMVEQLVSGGFQVTAASSGAEALLALQRHGPPDALVCDLSMPGMNGIDVIQRARERHPDLPCFLLTGYAGERAMQETGSAYILLRKPISARALIAQIDAGLAAAPAPALSDR